MYIHLKKSRVLIKSRLVQDARAHSYKWSISVKSRLILALETPDLH